MDNSLLVRMKQLESMKQKSDEMNQDMADVLSDYDEEINDYLSKSNDPEVKNISDKIKSLHKSLADKSYNFNPLNVAIYIEQIVGDLIELYARAFKLMIENMQRKEKSQENQKPEKVKVKIVEQFTEITPVNIKEVQKPKEKSFNDKQDSRLKESSQTRAFSNNLSVKPASQPYMSPPKAKTPEKSQGMEAPTMGAQMGK